MKKQTIAIVLLVVAASMAAFLFWRANSGPTGNQVSVRVTEDTVRLQKPLAASPTPKRRYKVGVLFPFMASPFWVNEAYGVLNQAEKLGVDVVWLSADGYDNVDKQSAQLEDLATQKVDAILIAATNNTGVVPSVERVVVRGIPVFAHVTSAATKSISSSVVDDDLSIGQQQAQFMGQALKGKGAVAMLNGPAAADWASLRVKGFKQVMAQEFPGIKIVAERNGIPDRADAQRLTEDLLAANPGLSGLFSVADGMAMGAADAIVSAKRSGIVVTTASFSQESLPYMAKGLIALNVDENPVLMGRAALDNVVRALNGEAVSRQIYVPNPAYSAAQASAVDSNGQWAPKGWTPK
jgi:ABC-type sugar transport system substrate-binding protein